MDEDVFRNPKVVALSRDFTALRVDLTKRHPYQESLQKNYRIRGVPTVVFLNPEGQEIRGLRTEAYVPASKMLKRMREALPVKVSTTG